MKKLLITLLLVTPGFAFAAGGVLGDDCQVTACDTAAGFTCDYSSNTCQPTAQVKNSAPSSVTTGSNDFVALAPIPGLTDGQPADNIPIFLNNLYKYLVGVAAILAIAQIMRGGFQIATSEAVGGHSNGRALITEALVGLLLVLSPAIVFAIINPKILNLSYSLPAIEPKVPQSNSTPSNSGNGAGGYTNGSTFVTGGKLIPCGNDQCKSAKDQCLAGVPAGYTMSSPILCINSSGGADSRLDSTWNPFTNYACPTKDTPTLHCSYSQSTTEAK